MDSENEQLIIDDFILAANAQQSAYHLAVRGKTADLSANAPERFARAWLKEFCTRSGISSEEFANQLDYLLPNDRMTGFTLIAAALNLISEHRFEKAEVFAAHAYALDQHETFAQRIILAAREAAPNLNLKVDQWLAERHCDAPFNEAEVIGSKDMYFCCAAWLPAPLGSVEENSIEDLWKNERAQEIRRSISDGDFSYCSRMSCPKIARRELPRRTPSTKIKTTADLAQSTGPNRILLSYDMSCNLSCPSCRKQLVLANRKQTEKLDTFYNEKLRQPLRDAKMVKVTGSGDPFGSRHFRTVLKDLMTTTGHAPQLQLHTNGVLFDPEVWNELRLDGRVASVWVSIDAAQEKTYNALRPGGDFDRLMRNLRHLGQLRQANKLDVFRLDFVVQRDNWRQMKELILLARDVGASGVHFLMLRNWGTFDQKGFLDRDVCNPAHPDHSDLIEFLSDPIFRDRDVDLGNLSSLRPKLATPFLDISRHRDIPIIAVCGTGRSGTNYLFQLMRRRYELLVLSELFNPAGSYGAEARQGSLLKIFNQRFETNFSREKDRVLARLVRTDPLRSLDDARRSAAESNLKGVVFKVFRNHLIERSDLRTLFADPNVYPVLTGRALLPTYVSTVKARETETWTRRDTTVQKPNLSVMKFLEWSHTVIDWYDFLDRALTQTSRMPKSMIYEDWSNRSAPDIDTMITSVLSDISPALEQSRDNVDMLFKQDREARVTDRFSNGLEFSKELNDCDLGWMASYVPVPSAGNRSLDAVSKELSYWK